MPGRDLHRASLIVTMVLGVLASSFGWPAEALDECSDVRCLAKAAANATQYVKDDDLEKFAENLARAGFFDEARAAVQQINPAGPRADFYRNFATDAIILREIAAASWKQPEAIADLSSMAALSGNRQATSSFWVLCEYILNGSRLSSLNLDVTRLLSRKLQRRGPNATLQEILSVRWPAFIEVLPRQKQGFEWNKLAQFWLKMGNSKAAADAAERAEISGAYDFQGRNLVYDYTGQIWLSMGRLDRALAAARRQSSSSGAAGMIIKVAESLIAAGSKEEALALLGEARTNVRKERSSGWRANIFRRILAVRLSAGDGPGAGEIADEMLAIAKEPSLFPSDSLTDAAAAYNDIGDRQRAIDILQKADALLPEAHRVIGFSLSIGPVTGSTLGVADSIRSKIAVELYRAGDRAKFETLLGQMSPWHKGHTWMRIHDETRIHRESGPSNEEVLQALTPVLQIIFLNNLAGEGLLDADIDRAKQLVDRALASSDAAGDNVGPIIDTALVALAGEFTEKIPEALNKAEIGAKKIEDPGRRAFQLALVAASKLELLGH